MRGIAEGMRRRSYLILAALIVAAVGQAYYGSEPLVATATRMVLVAIALVFGYYFLRPVPTEEAIPEGWSAPTVVELFSDV